MRIESPRDWLDRFQAETGEPDPGRRAFDVIDKRIVGIDVDGFVWIKRGTVVAYRGDLRFHLEPVLQPEGIHATHGPARSAIKRELVPIVKAEGQGRLYVSDDSKYNQVVRLNGETIYVAAASLLAFEPALDHEIVLLGGLGVLAGGLLVVKLSGTGLLAISVHGDPLTLRVAGGDPVSADPTATVAWSGGLWPELKTDLEARSVIGHGGGEPIQMCFRGTGAVVVNARSGAEARRASFTSLLTSTVTELLA